MPFRFNPCQPCCEEQPEIFPCCGCNSTSHDDVLLTSERGSVTLKWEPGNIWRGCQEFSHDRTAQPFAQGICLYTFDPGYPNPGYPGGSSGIEWILQCNGLAFDLTCRTYQLNCQGGLGGWYYSRDVFCGPDGKLVNPQGGQPAGILLSNIDLLGTIVSASNTQTTFDLAANPNHPDALRIVTQPVTIDVPQGLVSTTLFLSDGFDTVALIYDATTPVGSGECQADPTTFLHAIIFCLTCDAGLGYVLRLFYRGCSYHDDGLNLNRHIAKMPQYTCGGGWTNGHDVFVAKNGATTSAESCEPFSLLITQTLPTTYPDHALREIYGDSATWLITS
jgi:hypothetical protein